MPGVGGMSSGVRRVAGLAERGWCVPGDFEPVGLFCPTDGEVASVADMNARVAGHGRSGGQLDALDCRLRH